MHEEKLPNLVEKGDLGLPKILFYYYAFYLRHLSHWAIPPAESPPVHIRTLSLHHPLLVIVFVCQIASICSIPSHPIIPHLQKILRIVLYTFEIYLYLSLSSGIQDNPKGLVGELPLKWKEWMNGGIHALCHLYKGRVPKTFPNMVEQFNLANNQFCRYLQLRHLLVSIFSSLQTHPQGLDLFKEILHIAETRHGASSYQSTLMSKPGYKTIAALKTVGKGFGHHF